MYDVKIVKDGMCINEGKHLDKLYVCLLCNMDFLFLSDIKMHFKLTGHQEGIVIWLDDVVRMDNFM